MAPKFKVPKSLEDLTRPPRDGHEETLYAQEVIEIDGLDASEMHRLVGAVVTDLADKDVLCVVEQPVFDQLLSLTRGYSFLDVSAKSILIDSLCTNFVQLNVSTSILLNSMEDASEDADDIFQQSRLHCNAVKIYAYFLVSILNYEEGQLELSTSKTSGSAENSKGRSRKKHVPQDWDWTTLRTRTLRVLAGALQNDLQRICESPQVDETLITLLAKAAFKLMENRALLEKGDCKAVLCTIIAACTVKYGCRISSIVTIIDMLHKCEHLPAHIAFLVSLAENQYSGCSLTMDLLRAVGQINPKNFERDGVGAENVGLFLEELACRLPKLMLTNLSVIMCHLDGKAYKMRNSLVKVIGQLLVEAKRDPEGIGASDGARLHNEKALLSILIERSRDVTAYTRKHVLQTWAILCKEKAVPIGHWNTVSELAAGRLEDNSAIVRKSALQLLATLLEHNPFGPSLRTAAFEATFEKYSEKLAEMAPQEMTEDREIEDNGKEINFNGEDDQAKDATSGAPDDVEEERSSQPQRADPPQAQQASTTPPFSTDIGGLEHTRALVASLESALRFSKCIGSTVDTLARLLASSSIGDVESTIQLLILCKKFDIGGSGSCLRKTLPLVFSQEKGIKTAVQEAFKTLYLKGSPSEVAVNLTNLALEATLGDLASMEALVSSSVSQKEVSPGSVSALWDFFTFNAQGSTPEQSRAALTVLCMAAKSNPHILSSHIQNILDIGFGRWAKDDVLLARCACVAVQRLPEKDRASFKRNHKIFSILSSLIVGPGLSEACWYSAAEQAINAIYAIHPAPESFSSGLLVKFAQSVFSGAERFGRRSVGTANAVVLPESCDFSALSVAAVSRFLFAVAHISIKHLVYIESCLKKVRKQRGDVDNSAANNAEETTDTGIAGSKEESIAAELGIAAAEEARLDELAERAETEMINGDGKQSFLISAIAPMVATLSLNSKLMRQHQHLRSSAMLALCKLMAIDANFCEKHLQLLFTVAQKSREDSVRSNCVIALGDLALRFPNLLEPWMESMYARVHDQSISVRKNAVLVLSHLILNDLIKVKGYISEMAVHVVDADQRISDLVKLFFNELSKKGNNPVNNLLPDILSRLSSNSALPQEHFNLIMQFLTSTIKKSKQLEGLIEKFCNRFTGTSDVRQWQDIAYCLSQLPYSSSCLKKLADHFKLYQHALGDIGVFDNLKSLIVKTRKLAPAELKLVLDEFEEKLNVCHNAKREQEEALHKAQEHHRRTSSLQARHSGEVNANGDSSGNGLEGESLEDSSKVRDEPMEAQRVEHQTIVDEEPIVDSDFHTEIEETTNSTIVKAEEDADGFPSTSIADELSVGAVDQNDENVVHVDLQEAHRTPGVEASEGPSSSTDDERIFAKKICKTEIASLAESADVSQLRNSENDFSGSQPYPYMDLDLESAMTAKEPEPAAGNEVDETNETHRRGEIELENLHSRKEKVADVIERVVCRTPVQVKDEVADVLDGKATETPTPHRGESDRLTERTRRREASGLRSSQLTSVSKTSTVSSQKKGKSRGRKTSRAFGSLKHEAASGVDQSSADQSKVLRSRNRIKGEIRPDR